jgi:hypothetical protein
MPDLVNLTRYGQGAGRSVVLFPAVRSAPLSPTCQAVSGLSVPIVRAAVLNGFTRLLRRLCADMLNCSADYFKRLYARFTRSQGQVFGDVLLLLYVAQWSYLTLYAAIPCR